MAGNHVAVWPKVRVTAKGKSVILVRGETVPAGVDAVELDNLVTFGAIAGVVTTDVVVEEVFVVQPSTGVVEPALVVDEVAEPSTTTRSKRGGSTS